MFSRVMDPPPKLMSTFMKKKWVYYTSIYSIFDVPQMQVFSDKHAMCLCVSNVHISKK